MIHFSLGFSIFWLVPTNAFQSRYRAACLAKGRTRSFTNSNDDATTSTTDDKAMSNAPGSPTGPGSTLKLAPSSSCSLANFEWPLDDADTAPGTELRPVDVALGAGLFALTHLNAILTAKELHLELTSDTGGIFIRSAGVGLFVALEQAAAPPPRALGVAAQDDGPTASTEFFRGLAAKDFCRVDWKQNAGVIGQRTAPWIMCAILASAPTLAHLAYVDVAAVARHASTGTALFPHLSSLRPLSLVETCLVTPLAEEIVFRGFLMEALRRAKVPYAASIGISAVTFGLWHLDRGLDVQSFFLGAYWAQLYGQSRNILLPASMHVFWNAAVELSRAI